MPAPLQRTEGDRALSAGARKGRSTYPGTSANRAVKLAVKVNLSSSFDGSVEGQWRATGDASKVRAGDLSRAAEAGRGDMRITSPTRPRQRLDRQLMLIGFCGA